MKKILVIQNGDMGPPALIADVMIERGLTYETCMPHTDHPSTSHLNTTIVPSSMDDYSAMVIMGGAMDSFDHVNYPAFPVIIERIQQTHQQEKPCLGICLGSQLMASAFGANVYRHSEVEVGFSPLSLTPEGLKDPIFNGITASPLHFMQWHSDTFDLPKEAALLTTGERCHHQVYRYGAKSYGFQPHIELSCDAIRQWIRESKAARLRNPQLPQELEEEMAAHIASAMAFGKIIAHNWLDML